MDRCLEDDSSTEASFDGSCDRAAGDTIGL